MKDPALRRILLFDLQYGGAGSSLKFYSGGSLVISKYEGFFRNFKIMKNGKCSIPVEITSPEALYKALLIRVMDSERRAEEYQVMAMLHSFKALAIDMGNSNAERHKAIWSRLDYLMYQYQKNRDPSALKPFDKEADKIDEEMVRLQEWFESGEGIRING